MEGRQEGFYMARYPQFQEVYQTRGYLAAGTKYAGKKRISCKKFNTFEEVITFYKDLKKHNTKFKNSRGPNRRRPNDDGFYENNIRSLKKVMSVKEIHKNRGWGLSKKNKYKLHTCYRNTSDKSTLEFWLIFYT